MARHVIILGAGISGLSCAWRLSDNGIRTDVLESSLSVGGLAATMREGSYSLDVGPHSFFSDDEKIVNLVRGLFEKELQPIPRKVKFFYKDKYLDYPLTAKGVLFQMGLWSGMQAACSFLKSKIFPCKRHLIERGSETMEDWAIANFGGYLYRTFFKPYTEQFWKVSCSELSSRSIPTYTRMSFVNTLKLLLHRKVYKQGDSLLEREMRPTYYPATGFAEIAEKIARLIESKQGNIHPGCEVTGISEISGGRMRVFFQRNGRQETMESDHVISTIPLPSLAKILNPSVPSEVQASADKLEYRSLVVLGMLTDKQKILNCGYVYLLDRPFNRIFEMNEFSPKTSLPGENILAVEIPCLRDSVIWTATKEELFDMCIASMSKDGFVLPGDIKRLFLVKAPHAYPIYRKDYLLHLTRLKDHLKGYKSLSTLGRCGEFMYMDIDECMKRAFVLADNYILLNT